jgi:hypothetical protein
MISSISRDPFVGPDCSKTFSDEKAESAYRPSKKEAG